MASVAVPDSDEDGQTSPKIARTERGSASRAGGGAVTLDDLQRLLEQQSKALAQSQATEIRSAIKELKQATSAELRGIKEEVLKHGDYIAPTPRPRGQARSTDYGARVGQGRREHGLPEFG